MSVSLDIRALEKEIEAGNFILSDRIENIRKNLLLNENDQISNIEGKTISLCIWNIAIKLQRKHSSINKSDVTEQQFAIIPTLRILATDIYQKYMDQQDNDGAIFLNMLAYTYKSLLDVNNIELANKYLELSKNIFPQLRSSPYSAAIMVKLTIWQAQLEISHNKKYDNALVAIKKLSNRYKIQSSLLVSFVYEKSIENCSLDWIQYGLELVASSYSFPSQWENLFKTLLAQFYINNNEPEKATEVVSCLPNSISNVNLKLKCRILLSPREEILKEELISFIHQSISESYLLVDLCVFIANHSDEMGQTSMEFIKEVMNTSLSIPEIELKKHIFFSAIQISCELNDIENAIIFLEKIKGISDEVQKEIAVILWNKALDMFDSNDYEESAKWMQLSRNLISDDDNVAQSCYFRFICRCFFEAGKHSEALSYANDAIQRQPKCSHGYLLKFRILVKMNNENDAFNLVSEILNNIPFIEEFEPSFLSTIAAEIYIIGNKNLALETLLKIFELNFNLNKRGNSDDTSNKSAIQATILKSLKKKIINSIFAILQEIDDITLISKAINRVSTRWNSQVIYKIINNNENDKIIDGNDSLLLSFTSTDIISYTSIAFKNGMELKKKNKWKKAIKSFMNGSLFSGDMIECKAPCIFEAVDCYIKIISSEVSLHINDIKSNDVASNSQLMLVKGLLDEISPLIENSPNIEQKLKDGLLLSRIKFLLVTMNCCYSKESHEHFAHLIENISSSNLFFEICVFMCENKFHQEIYRTFLDHAKKFDQLSNNCNNEKSHPQLSASLLYQLIVHSKTLDESKKSYDIIMDFLGNGESILMNSSQLQFFMSYAWNIGVKCVRSLRSKEGESWFKKALTIMGMSEDLKSQYGDELNEKYLQFLVNNKSRIAFSF
ncbi:hypothetical protein M9Y10_035005 [Tritrichomonas musculus]|uniref:Protein ZIP4 homolog n=1 Tax=Tritrichomonas musculus TaxID=1915356 RepID=A0ABR2KGY9_9EUKA